MNRGNTLVRIIDQKDIQITHIIENLSKKQWGEKAVVEWLFHIAIDNIVTAYRASNEVYETAYNYYKFGLPDHGELVIDFDKLSNAELLRRFRDKKE